MTQAARGVHEKCVIALGLTQRLDEKQNGFDFALLFLPWPLLSQSISHPNVLHVLHVPHIPRIPHIFSAKNCYILCDMLFDINSDILSGISLGSLFGITVDILSALTFDILSLTFCLT